MARERERCGPDLRRQRVPRQHVLFRRVTVDLREGCRPKRRSALGAAR